MKLIGDRFSRNGHNVFKGTVRALDDDGSPMGWAEIVNIDNRKDKLALVEHLANDLSIALDDARRMVNELHKSLEMEASAAEGLPDDDDGAKKSQATTLVDLAERAELWHTPEGTAFATIDVDSHRETWPLKARGFKEWLSYLFFQDEGKAPGGQAVADAIATLSGKALFEGAEWPVFTRIAEVDGIIYVDLCNTSWDVAQVTSAGWTITSDIPVRFRRTRGMLSLPYPIPGGNLGLLRGLLNLASDEDWALYISCLIQALRGKGPYPALVLFGEHGSAKSTAARVYRRLVDPNKADLRSLPKDERDLRIQATNGWIVGYDNLSSLPEWLSNALCRLSTGGGMGTRELYSDDEEVLFDGQRPAILNGIEEISTRPDLVDRSVILELPAIPDEQRMTENNFWTSFDQKHPSILGGLLDALVVGLARLPEVQLTHLPRMADFAVFATAAEPGLGLESGTFMDAYRKNRSSANESAIEGHVIGPYLVQLMEDQYTFMGTATELLEKLNSIAPDEVTKAKGWPKRSNVLSNKLRALAPNLREVGIDIDLPRTGRKRQIVMTCPDGPPSYKNNSGKDRHDRHTVTDPSMSGDDGDDHDDDFPKHSNESQFFDDDLEGTTCASCKTALATQDVWAYDDAGDAVCRACAEG